MRFTENELVDETKALVHKAPDCLRAWSWLLWTSPTVSDNVAGMTMPLPSELEALGAVSPLARYLLAEMKETLMTVVTSPDDAGSPSIEARGACPHQSPLRILVVDDDEMFSTLLVRRVRELGHRPMAVTSGERALEVLAAEPFDAVLMDCQMPGLDGYETTRRLRHSEAKDVLAHRGRLPVIAVSGQERDTAMPLCLAAGMDDYLSKPPSSSELTLVLELRLSAPRSRIAAHGRAASSRSRTTK